MKIVRLNDVPDEQRSGYSIKRLFTESLTTPAENVGFYETTIPLGSTCPEHYHANLDEVIYFVSKGKMRCGDEIEYFEPGDIVILKPGDKHEFVADEFEIKLIAVKLPNNTADKVVSD